MMCVTALPFDPQNLAMISHAVHEMRVGQAPALNSGI